MSRFSLEKSDKSRSGSVTPEVLPPSPSDGTGFSLPAEAITGAIDVARQLVTATHDIAAINANSKAKVCEMEKEIERITVETRNYVDRLEAESKGWHSRFDKRKAFSEKILAELGRHPEWSDAMREKVIDFAQKTMEL